MVIDSSELSRATEYEFCVIGSGPAGMTVARELADAGRHVIVLESGVAKGRPETDALRATEVSGIPVKDCSRERVLGGTSSTWAGLSSPYDQIDFLQRPDRGSSGWPISRRELDPFYRLASERYRFAPADWFRESGPLCTVRSESTVELKWSNVEEKLFLAAVEPQHFGREHAGIFRREGVDLTCNATVVALGGGTGKRMVDFVETRTVDGGVSRVRAKAFVLATGGIENARLLLNSRGLRSNGLGNESDNVGRYLMNHPKNYAGLIRLRHPVAELPYYFGFTREGFAGYAGLRLPQDAQWREGLLNCYVRFEPVYGWSNNGGVEAFVSLLRRARSLMRALPQIKPHWSCKLAERLSPSIRTVHLRNFMEMEPRRENRVTLSKRLDQFGMPLPRVNHDTSALDRHSLRVLHERLAADVARLGLGEFVHGLPPEGEPWPVAQDASHHIGTTRMGADPATSVVNTDCRLHNVANVYMAGSSVFPTSGNANPTYTIVALAIRLARHLNATGC